jgi:hypothetical protein
MFNIKALNFTIKAIYYKTIKMGLIEFIPQTKLEA